jgi:hypothetical protein
VSTEPEHHHIFELFDPSKYLQAFELDGKDLTLTIRRITGETIEGEQNRKARKPVLYFAEWKDGRGLVLNKTNAKTLIALYGPDYRQWIGKRMTLFPTTTKMAGEEVDAIRVRKRVPSAPQRAERPVKSIQERVATFKSMLRTKDTEADVEELWTQAVRLRDEVDPETLEQMTLSYESRIAEVRELTKGE